MSTTDLITDCKTVRNVIGWTGNGVIVVREKIDEAKQTLSRLLERGDFQRDATAETARAMRALAQGVMPSQAMCRAALKEVDGYLLPLRARQRSAEHAPQYERARG